MAQPPGADALEMSTAAQRRASRRNLVKARAFRSRGRRVHLDIWLLKPLSILIGVVLLLGLAVVSRELVLVPVTLGALGFAAWNSHHHNIIALEQARIRQGNQEWIRREGEAHVVRAMSLQSLLAVTPREFEYTVATLLARSGYIDVAVSGGPGDLSADITGRHPDGRYLIVQCKQYGPSQKISSPAMQQFIGMGHVHHRAELLMYVTTARFTRPAAELARKHDVALVDGDVLVEWAQSLAPVATAHDASNTSRCPRV